MPRCFVMIGLGLGLALLAAPAGLAQSGPARSAALKIVVIEGEGAVNVVQQKTAVAPVVEVRDRNNQPVSGAVVQFAIRGGRATFNGARTLTVTTNAAGRAAVAGFTPTSTGALQITASATFQGQAAAVTIAQTNVLTAAQAASAASASGGAAGGASGGAATGGTAGGATASGAAGSATASGAAAAGAAGGGAAAAGGIATTTLVVTGAAIGGGALVATEVVGKQSEDGSTPDVATTYTASYSVPVTFTRTTTPAPPAVGTSCADDRRMAGTISIALDNPSATTVTGTATASYTQTTVGGSCSSPLNGNFDLGTASVTGTPANFTVTLNRTTTGSGGNTVFDIMVFTGSVAGAVVSGSVDYRGGANGPTNQAAGAVVFPVTLK